MQFSTVLQLNGPCKVPRQVHDSVPDANQSKANISEKRSPNLATAQGRAQRLVSGHKSVQLAPAALKSRPNEIYIGLLIGNISLLFAERSRAGAADHEPKV